MLKLTARQIEAFAEWRVRCFIETLATHLREIFPLRYGAMVDGDLTESLEPIVRAALDHGIETEHAICLWVDLIAAHEAPLDVLQEPTVSATLHGAAPETTKLRQLAQLLDKNIQGLGCDA